MKPVLAVLASVVGSSFATDIFVRCGAPGTAPSGSGTQADPFSTLAQAQTAVRAIPRGSSFNGATVHVDTSQHCYLQKTLVLDLETDGGTSGSGVQYAAWQVQPSSPATAMISGGLPIMQSWLESVSDSWTKSLLPSSSEASVKQINVGAHYPGISTGDFLPHVYLGGNAEIDLRKVTPTAMELFWYAGDDASSASDGAEVPSAHQDVPSSRRAAYPDPSLTDINHRSVAESAFDGNFMTVDNDTAARLHGWAEQVSSPGKGDVWASGYWNGIGWAQSWREVVSVFPANSTLEIGPSPSPDTHLNKGAYFHVLNLVSELDSPGEYTLNRSTATLYGIPPINAAPAKAIGPDGDAIVAHVSALFSVVNVTGAASYVTFKGIDFRHATGSALIVEEATGVAVQGGSIQSVGGTGLNVTESPDFSVSGTVVCDTGSGGIVLYGGNRTTLTSMGATASGVTVTRYNRVSRVYAAGVMLGGVGNSLLDSRVFDAPHMSVFWQGNKQVISGNTMSDLCQETRDSGAIYAGRDYTYSATISNNNISNVNTALGRDVPGHPHNQVQAVYLDDMVSNVHIVNNTFTNVSVALLLGGGRNNVFSGNRVIDLCEASESAVVAGTLGSSPTSSLRGRTVKFGSCGGSAVAFDNRGMGWAARGCKPGGTQFNFLSRVPYNTSAVWLQTYPKLANLTSDGICVPKYNSVSENTYCNLNGETFINQAESTLQSWQSTALNNLEKC